jgi:hypothetical protein
MYRIGKLGEEQSGMQGMKNRKLKIFRKNFPLA